MLKTDMSAYLFELAMQRHTLKVILLTIATTIATLLTPFEFYRINESNLITITTTSFI